MWKKPGPIDWSVVPDLQEVEATADLRGNSDAQYRSVMESYEHVINEQLISQGNLGFFADSKVEVQP